MIIYKVLVLGDVFGMYLLKYVSMYFFFKKNENFIIFFATYFYKKLKKIFKIFLLLLEVCHILLQIGGTQNYQLCQLVREFE